MYAIYSEVPQICPAPPWSQNDSFLLTVRYQASKTENQTTHASTSRNTEASTGGLDSRCFSTLDASQAYMNIPLKESCKSKTAFVCCFGLFKFLCLPFGLRNKGAAYCRLVQAVVDEINDPRLSAYLDDVILHTGDSDTHGPLGSDPGSTLPGRYQAQRQENHSVQSSCWLSWVQSGPRWDKNDR